MLALKGKLDILGITVALFVDKGKMGRLIPLLCPYAQYRVTASSKRILFDTEAENRGEQLA